MRKILLILLVKMICLDAIGQQSPEAVVRHKIDSIISLASHEPDDAKKVNQLLAIYTVSIDAYPVLLLETYQKLYKIGTEKKDIIIESSAWSVGGQGYRMAGNYVKALECHYKAVALAEQSKNQHLLNYARNQMAHIYKDRLENDKALQLYRLASVGDGNGDYSKVSWWAFMNMGAVYLNMGQLDSSLFYSFKSQSLLPPGAEKEITYVYILSNIGSVYSKKGDTLKAKEYFHKALDIAESSRSQRYINSTSMAIAEHFNRLHQFDSSVFYARKAIDIVQGTMLSNLALQPAKLLANMYQDSKADSALKYWKVYMAANDSLYSIRTSQQLMMLSFDEDQRKKNIEEEKKRYQNQVRTNLLLGGLVVFCLVALILYRNNKQKQKANTALSATLSELKAAQKQLIQSEKMASLGELTAGVAHEIQNPLNFVNNFSDVNRELVNEAVEEIDKGNLNDAKEILKDVKENSEKINHHGKRADAIVKGMLQHSQSSNGKKEPTDINALCDEYLRLSYHGVRAKDNSFNATLKTDFDPSVGKINIIPQDIGRVVMNLLTNAFYAVNDRRQQITGDRPPITGDQPVTRHLQPETELYVPTVSISTKKLADKIEIKVTDNGNGIPQNIIDKIFQPFFTTKPTGQGTGLGLSLAYDIVKSQGGDLKVETKEGEGTEFFIQIPKSV